MITLEYDDRTIVATNLAPGRWVAMEAARVWMNENPSGEWFPSHLKVSLADGSTGIAESAEYGRGEQVTLSMPFTIEASLGDAREAIRRAVRAALGTDWVRDGRHLMNHAECGA